MKDKTNIAFAIALGVTLIASLLMCYNVKQPLAVNMQEELSTEIVDIVSSSESLVLVDIVTTETEPVEQVITEAEPIEQPTTEAEYVDEITPEILAEVGCTPEDFEYYCRTATAEIRGGTQEQISNVVNVIRNRVKSEKFPDTVKAVCTSKSQFVVAKYVAKGLDKKILKALQEEDTTNGALFFCTCENCKVAKSKKFVKEDGSGHSFYK